MTYRRNREMEKALSRSALTVYILLVCFLEIVPCTATFPALGVALGPKYITAAQALDNGTVIEVARVEGSESYKRIYAQTASSSTRTSDSLVASLEPDFAKLKHAAEARLGRAVDYVVVENPENVNVNTLSTVRKAMEMVGLLTEIPDIGGLAFRWGNAVQQAYALNTCEGRRLPADCDLDDEFVALVLDYGDDSLEINVVDMPAINSAIRYRAEHAALGEKSAISYGRKKYSTVLNNELDRVISEQFSLTILPYDDTNWKPSVQSLQAVIFCGDASPMGFDELRSSLVEYVHSSSQLSGLHAGWLRDGINPSFVTAFGAARRAKRMRDEPYHYQPFHIRKPMAHGEL